MVELPERLPVGELYRYIFVYSHEDYKHISEIPHLEDSLLVDTTTEGIFNSKNIISYDDFKDNNNFETISLRETALKKPKIAFFASNDTHAMSYIPLIEKIPNSRVYISHKINENATKVFNDKNIKYFNYSKDVVKEFSPDVFLVSNDWGPFEQIVLSEVRYLKIPTVGLQEGCLDFGSRRPFLKGTDYTFVTGLNMVSYVNNKVCFVTGNPRFDAFEFRDKLPADGKVMINVNFTYGVHENDREAWLSDIVSTCDSLGMAYFISQHPRDRADLKSKYENVINSGASSLKEQLSKTRVLVTRFSTLVYEASLFGIPVIYYNPHNEKMRLFNEDTVGGIYVCRNIEELEDSLKEVLNKGSSNLKINEYSLLNVDRTTDPSYVKISAGLKIIPVLYKACLNNDSYLPSRVANYIKLKIYNLAKRLKLR